MTGLPFYISVFTIAIWIPVMIISVWYFGIFVHLLLKYADGV